MLQRGLNTVADLDDSHAITASRVPPFFIKRNGPFGAPFREPASATPSSGRLSEEQR
jgi:hypothetical protein